MMAMDADSTLSPLALPGNRQNWRVVQFVGYGRSGSTLLSRMLGAAPGVFNCGELRRIWHAFETGVDLCECGESIRQCPFWREVRRRTASQIGEDEMKRLGAVDDFTVLRQRHLARFFFAPRADLLRGPRGRYAEAMRTLYSAVAEVAAAQVLVDSTKQGARAFLLARAMISTHLLMLVRDGRAVTYSWAFRAKYDTKLGGQQVSWPLRRPVTTSWEWVLRNTLALVIALRCPSTRLRYEDLVSSPEKTLTQLCASLAIPSPWSVVSRGEGAIEVPQGHMAGGNPDVSRKSRTILRRDDEWMHATWPHSRRAASLICSPLLFAFGYPLATSRSRVKTDGGASETHNT